MTLKATIITVLIAFVIGGFIGRCTVVPKTIITRSIEDAKTISDLETKIKSLTKIHTVTTTTGNTSVTTSDTTIDSNTNITGGTTSTSSTQADSKTVIGGNYFMMPFVNIGQRIDTGGAFIGADVFGSIGIAVGGEYNWEIKTHKEYLGVYFRF